MECVSDLVLFDSRRCTEKHVAPSSQPQFWPNLSYSQVHLRTWREGIKKTSEAIPSKYVAPNPNRDECFMKTNRRADAEEWKRLLRHHGLAKVTVPVKRGAKEATFTLAEYGELTRLAVQFKDERKDQ